MVTLTFNHLVQTLACALLQVGRADCCSHQSKRLLLYLQLLLAPSTSHPPTKPHNTQQNSTGKPEQRAYVCRGKNFPSVSHEETFSWQIDAVVQATYKTLFLAAHVHKLGV
jgi:hypothetical protein